MREYDATKTVQAQIDAEVVRLRNGSLGDEFWAFHRAGSLYQEAMSYYTCIDPRPEDIVPRLVELSAIAEVVAENVQRRGDR